MISGSDSFAVWAPDSVFWSQWAKPVVFANSPGLATDHPLVIPELATPGIPGTFDQSAIVVDLPGVHSVLMGLALAQRGFRPVPLFNGTSGPNPIVPMQALEDALGGGVEVLQRLTIAPDAKPAFLLDSDRHNPIGGGEPGRYDNRWIVLPEDFPSGTALLAHGIKGVTVIRQRAHVPDQDLTHVLLRWKEAGLGLRGVSLESGTIEDPLSLQVPSSFRSLWYGAIALMGLRRNSVGGFGAIVPQQTRSSGFYG